MIRPDWIVSVVTPVGFQRDPTQVPPGPGSAVSGQGAQVLLEPHVLAVAGALNSTAASPPSRRGSAQHAGRLPGKTRPSRPYPTGTPWPNRHRSTSSTSRCSGSPLPSPGHAGDPPPSASAAPTPPPSDAASPPSTFPDGGLFPISPRRLALCPCGESSCGVIVPPTSAAVRLDFLSLGLIIDARQVPREIQEEAFRRGLIPYLP